MVAHNPHVSVGTCPTIPVIPPNEKCALAIFDSFVLAFRHFEQDLHKASRAYAQQRRETNPT